MMTEEEYLQTQQQIVLIAGLVSRLPLREFIADAEKADAVGPFVDPTLWREGHAKLGDILDIARSLRNFQDLVLTKQKLAAEAEGSDVK